MDDDNDAEMEDAVASASANVIRSTSKSSSAYTLHAHKVPSFTVFVHMNNVFVVQAILHKMSFFYLLRIPLIG